MTVPSRAPHASPVVADLAPDFIVSAVEARVVTLFAPCGYEADPTRLVAARSYFERHGYRVDLALTVGGRHQRFSGTDDERLAWLDSIVVDPSAGIVLALRGGYGATRLLPAIDFTALAAAVARGKRLVGHSDFTALSLGLLATTGAVSFSGPMAGFGFGRSVVDPFTEAHFWRAMEEQRVDVAFETPFDGRVDVDGRLWGGNLSMIASLIGTPWLPLIDDGILFVEDVNEQPYRIERMLLQLQQAGVLDRQRLVLCGDFTDYRVSDYDNGYGIPDALARVQATTPVPIVAGLPMGHGARTLTLAVGMPAEVAVAAGRVNLRQDWSTGA